MKTVRYSKQREAILLELQKRHDHPTADQIYYSLKNQYPELSLGTVYRNLGFLADHGHILKIDIGDGTFHYDGFIEPHIHFVCLECGKIYDIKLDNELYQAIEKKIEHHIEKVNIIMNGTCQSCIQEKKMDHS